MHKSSGPLQLPKKPLRVIGSAIIFAKEVMVENSVEDDPPDAPSKEVVVTGSASGHAEICSPEMEALIKGNEILTLIMLSHLHSPHRPHLSLADPLALAHFAHHIEKTNPSQREILLFCVDAERCKRKSGDAHEPSLRGALADQFLTPESPLLKEAVRRGLSEFNRYMIPHQLGDSISSPDERGGGGEVGSAKDDGEPPPLSVDDLRRLFQVGCAILEESCLPAFNESAEHTALAAKHTEQARLTLTPTPTSITGAL